MSAQLKALTIQNGTTRRILDASSLEVGNGVNSAAGQALTILSSDGVGAAGYNISMTAGLGDTLFRGGAVSVAGGQGGASDGSGTATGGNGGAIVLFTGTGGAATAIGDTSGDGGNIAVVASNAGTSVSGAIGGNGGRVTIFAGSASRTPGVAGTVQIMAGSANYVTGAGGDASLMGGQSGSGGVGGNAVVVGGSPFGLGTGGDATISGGSAFSGVGGNVRLNAGTGTAVGNIFIGNGDACPIYLGNADAGSVVDVQDFTANAAANSIFRVGAFELLFNSLQDHSIRVNDSAATGQALTIGAGAGSAGAGGLLTLTGGNGTGALGGNVAVNAGSGTTSGDIVLGAANTNSIKLSSNTVVQAGATLSTSGTGNINLPNNGSARFKIETVAVSANVTAANLGTLTAGPTSNADALHTHSVVAMAATAGQALAVGQVLAFYNGGTAYAWLASATDANKHETVGICTTAAAGAASPTAVQTNGQATIPNAYWDTAGGAIVPDATKVGTKVWLSNVNPGNLTTLAPSGSGTWIQKVGVVTRETNGTDVLIVLLVADSVYLP